MMNPCAPATTAQHLIALIPERSGEALIVEDTIFGTDDPDDTELFAMRICESCKAIGLSALIHVNKC